MFADTESRRIRQIEWKLNIKIFNKLQEIRGPFLVDLFTSRISHQLPTYISWLPDLEAWKTNAFSINWDLEGIYCFPPLCLIARILHKGDSPAVKRGSRGAAVAHPTWDQKVPGSSPPAYTASRLYSR